MPLMIYIGGSSESRRSKVPAQDGAQMQTDDVGHGNGGNQEHGKGGQKGRGMHAHGDGEPSDGKGKGGKGGARGGGKGARGGGKGARGGGKSWPHWS